MEAKDTVMSKKRIRSIWNDEAMTCFGSLLKCEYLLKDQAEISFEAGMRERRLKMNKTKIDLSKVPTNDLIGEIRIRQSGTYIEDAEWLRPTRGRGHSSISAKLLLEFEVDDVKRVYHQDVFCHQAPNNKNYYCGLTRTRDKLRKRGYIFNIYHEREHVAIVARIK